MVAALDAFALHAAGAVETALPEAGETFADRLHRLGIRDLENDGHSGPAAHRARLLVPGPIATRRLVHTLRMIPPLAGCMRYRSMMTRPSSTLAG